MARIVIDARELRTTTGRYVERLLHYLQKIDSENEYLILLKRKDYSDWQPSVKNFKKVATDYKEFSFGEQLGFKKQIKSLRPDLVHFAMVQQPIFYRGNVVTTMHDLTTTRFKNPSKNAIVFWVKQQVYKFVNRYVPRKSKAIITPSKYVKNDVVKFAKIKPTKITVTYEAADAITDKPEAIDKLRGKQFLFYVGRPTPHKNLDNLLGAFEILLENNPELLLVLGGKKDKLYKAYEQKVKDMGLQKNVIFTGFVSEGSLRWLYQNCKVYVFPSLSEGFGLPGLEAMMHRAPVAASEATCLPEVYGDAAQYFNPLDKYDMARTISELLTNTRLRQQMTIAGRKKAEQYSWQRMATETLAIYEQVLRK